MQARLWIVSTFLGLGLALGLGAGCSDGPSVEPAREAGKSPSRSAEPRTRSESLVVQGWVRAHDGSAPVAGRFTVIRTGFMDPLREQPLDAEGRFHATVPKPGVYLVRVSAVDHADVLERVVVQRDVQVRGRLGTYERSPAGPTLSLRAEFLDDEGSTLSSPTLIGERIGRADRYRVDLGDKPKAAVKLRYQLTGLTGRRSYNGPISDDHAYDGNGDFWSVVDVSERDGLVLDLDDLPPAGVQADLEWSGIDLFVAQVLDKRRAWEHSVSDVMRQARADGGIVQMQDDPRRRVDALGDEALREIAEFHDLDRRRLLRMAHMHAFGQLRGNERRQAEMQWLIDHVPADDPRWALFSLFSNATWRVFKSGDEQSKNALADYLQQRAETNPDAGVAIESLEILLGQARKEGDDDRVATLYALASAPRFSGTYTQKNLAKEYDPDRLLQPGRAFPEFSFPSIDEPDRSIGKADVTGGLVLLEFWATWCGPCVGQMPHLHRAYAEVNGARRRGSGEAGLRHLGRVRNPDVQFVFISMDQTPEHVQQFRRQKWSMPWIHAFAGDDWDVSDEFGFRGVPTAILLDAHGRILAVNEGLRGAALVKTLRQAVQEQDRGQGPTERAVNDQVVPARSASDSTL